LIASADPNVGFSLPSSPASPAIISRMAGSVLLVDDDPAFLSLATRMLDAVGVSVAATAETAAAALAAAEAHRPEAVLVDVGLPDRDGIELARELAALPWAPLVVLTSTDRDALGVSPNDGMRPFVPKEDLPFVPKEDLPNAPLRALLLRDA
jgi:CheY-like chemotaxis protein